MNSFSLYIHIPFCKSKCKYCDFFSCVKKNIPQKEYFDCLKKEFKKEISKKVWKGREIQSIYFGGGTPSLIDEKYYKDFLKFVFNLAPVLKNVEITLEGNPTSLSFDKLFGLKEAKINRLSIGAQSFNDKILNFLGRKHTSDDIISCFNNAKKVGFKNISLDLIFGVPKENKRILLNDLENLKDLNPSHISTYALTIEEKTYFGKLKKEGLLKETSDTSFLNQEKMISSFLKACDYERYEISNFAKNKSYSKHNFSYWNACDYLGLGAGAFSGFTNYKDNIATSVTRYSNINSINEYIKNISLGKEAVSFKEEVTGDSLIFEYIMLSLRKKEGINILNFKKRFGVSFYSLYEDILNNLLKKKLLIKDKNNIFINEEKLMVSNSIIEEFLK